MNLLTAARPIESRAMFGGLGLYLDGIFMGIVDDDRLYLKIDDESEAPYIERNMAVWTYDPSVKTHSYRELPDNVLNDPEECGKWLDEARNAAIRRKAKPKKKAKS